ncbi:MULTISPECIES: glycoside hydrolase family 16 protein [unclassified Kitasatospora]|uniref:glycoside hydrolase family 16 protein n=1 Tax=unclassified Kitasatospora TaxID=2633591 RepID=UPI0034099782
MNGSPSVNDARIGWALALSGWVALAVFTLADANPVRVAVSSAFLLCCPGLAAVRSARPRLAASGVPMGRLEAWMLTVALSLAIDTVITMAFYLTGGFISGWALAATAGATTLLALPLCLPRGGRPLGRGARARKRSTPDATDPTPTDPTPTDPASKDPTTNGRSTKHRRRRRGAGGAAVAGLLLVAACTGGTTTAPPTTDSGGGGSAGPDAGPAAPVAPGSWRLVFNDAFDGDRLDPANWTTCYDWNQDGCTNAGNHELEWYRPQQVTVGGGSLALTAKRSTTTGSDGKSYPWTSGMVSTGRDSWNGQPRHTFTHGYFAAAVRIPPEAGMFPAFWLLPASRTTPPELDVAEFISTTQYVQMTLHHAGPNGEDLDQWERYGPEDFAAGYHVFALDWESNSLTWYVDGVQRYQVTDPDKVPDVPMELLLNLAVGYPSSPPQEVTSARMTVDWVQVWQH